MPRGLKVLTALAVHRRKKISPLETRYLVLNIVYIPLISEGQNEFTLVTGVSFFN